MMISRPNFAILAILSITSSVTSTTQTEQKTECPGKPCSWDENSSVFVCENSLCTTFPAISHQNVKEIYLARNNIPAFPDHFTFSSLQLLDLAHNDLQNLPSRAFHNAMGLKVLDLSYNFLSNLENGELAHLSWLEGLWLHHNHLREIDTSVFKVKFDIKFSPTIVFLWAGHTMQSRPS